MGFGWRARSMQVMPVQQPAVITEKQEREMLEADLSDLKEEMKEIEERLKELKK
jgi:predicted transcriptional regulator